LEGGVYKVVEKRKVKNRRTWNVPCNENFKPSNPSEGDESALIDVKGKKIQDM